MLFTRSQLVKSIKDEIVSANQNTAGKILSANQMHQQWPTNSSQLDSSNDKLSHENDVLIESKESF